MRRNGTAPGLPEAGFRRLHGHGFGFRGDREVGLGFGGQDVSDGFEQTAVVGPVHPFGCRLFGGLDAAPRPAAVDDLGLEEPVDRLGQRVVVAVAETAHQGLDA